MKYFINFHTNKRQYNSKLWWTRWKKITTKIKSIFLYWSLQQSVTKFSSTPLSVTRNMHVDKTCLTRKFEPKEFFYLWTFTFNNASTTIFSTQASLKSTSILTIIAIELIYICIQSNTTTVLPFSIVSSQTAVTRALMKGASLVSVSGTCSYCTKKIDFVHCFCIQKYTWTHWTLPGREGSLV